MTPFLFLLGGGRSMFLPNADMSTEAHYVTPQKNITRVLYAAEICIGECVQCDT